MAFDPGDLEAAFGAAGIVSLTVTRRTFDGKWHTHATYDAKDWTKRKVVSTDDRSLETALVRLLTMVPSNPRSADDSLEDLL